MYKEKDQKLKIIRKKIEGKNYILWFLNDELIFHKKFLFDISSFKNMKDRFMVDFKEEIRRAIKWRKKNHLKDVEYFHQQILEFLKESE